MQRNINLSRTDVCIILHNIWQVLVPRPRRLRQLPLDTRKKNSSSGRPKEAGIVFSLFSQGISCSLWFFASAVCRENSLVSRGD